MKSLTIRLPTELVGQIEAESRARGISKSDIVRERLARPVEGAAAPGAALADLIGSVDGLPEDLSTNVGAYLASKGYGRKHSR
jgi:hypothetical protein